MIDIEAMKRNIERQLDEYEQAIVDAVKWHQEWKARQPKGFKIKRKSAAAVSHETGV